MLGVTFDGTDQEEFFALKIGKVSTKKDYVPAETYKDMTINPVHKMNIGERELLLSTLI